MQLLVHASVLMVVTVLMLGTIYTIERVRWWLHDRKHGPYWNE